MLIQDDARSYHRWQFRIGGLRFLISSGYLCALLVSGLAARLRDLLVAWMPQWWLAVPAAVLVIGLGLQILTLPLSLLGGFWLPRRYGLHHQTFARWIMDRMKAGIIGGILGVAGALIVYALLRSTPWWWLWAAATLFLGQVLLAFVTPIWLVPIFYRLTPLSEGDMRSRLLQLAEQARVPAIGVWIADQSRRSRTANAAVVGLGRTRRIVLFDTLVKEFQPDEVEAVLAHELGHHAAGDVWRGLAVQGVLTVTALWIADRVLSAGVSALGLSGPADIAGLPLLGLVTMAVSLVALPFVNGWSRRVETRADDFALTLTRDPGPFIRAMERLADLNLAERKPHFLKEVMLYSHPSVDRRVARARARA
ncbi:MAG TPA: M48 family metallopeptidase [Methylomirabilota bacterium]